MNDVPENKTGLTIALLFREPRVSDLVTQKRSITQMKTKLHLPRWKDVGSNLSGPGDTNLGIGSTVVLSVEGIEEFCAE